MTDPVMAAEYLVLSGGAANGISHLGVLQYVEFYLLGDEQIFHKFRGFAGSSIGACICFLINIGVSVRHIFELMQQNVAYMKTYHIHEKHLVLKEILHRVLRQRLGRTDINFRELHRLTGKELVVCATNFRTANATFFHHETTPTVRVLDAVRASMAIPLCFPMVHIQGAWYVDGGCSFNLPISVFPLQKSLCVWLRTRNIVAATANITQLSVYFKYLAQLFWRSSESLISHFIQQHKDNVVVIPTSLLQMDVSEEAIIQYAFKGALLMFCQHRHANPRRAALALLRVWVEFTITLLSARL